MINKTKFFWFKRFFVSFCFANELFYTTSKSGSKAYYLFRLGIQDYNRNNEKAVAVIVDIIFFEFSIGKLLR